jgi:HEAT repeat protein
LLIGACAAASFPAAGRAQDFDKLNRFMQTAGTSDDAMKAFRRGREFLAQEEWARAAEQFDDFVKGHPRHKETDAALYWLAFAQKKQGRLVQADATLERLFNEYPKSRWREDAEALRLELAPQLGKPEAINQAINKEGEELKLIALQSLFMSSPDRAAAVVANLLKPGSQANPRLKEAALMLAAQHGNEQTTALLIQLARNEADAKLRRQAVFWLGQTRDDRALDVLQEIAAKNDEEAAAQAAFAIAQNRSERATAMLTKLAQSAASRKVREQAIFGLGQRRGDGAYDELMKLYKSEQDAAVRGRILFAIGQSRSDKARAGLLEIARTEKNAEVRKQAIFALGQMRGEDVTATLAQLYDKETDEETKVQILFALSQSRGKEALAKLMQVAKGDASVKLRKQAIFWLGQSRDPEAAKFLEEILK